MKYNCYESNVCPTKSLLIYIYFKLVYITTKLKCLHSKSYRSSQLMLRSSSDIYPTNNAKSLACDTANEHALTCTRETCSCSQTAVQWNQWR